MVELIKEGIPYRLTEKEGDLEYVGTEVWIGGMVIMVINLTILVKSSS